MRNVSRPRAVTIAESVMHEFVLCESVPHTPTTRAQPPRLILSKSCPLGKEEEEPFASALRDRKPRYE